MEVEGILERSDNMPVKTKITRIGTITEDGTVKDWTFDGAGLGPRTVGMYPRKGLIGGYTINELQEICQLKRKLGSLTRGDAPRDLVHICPYCYYDLSFRERRNHGQIQEIWVCTNCLRTLIFTEQLPPEPKKNLLQRLLSKVW